MPNERTGSDAERALIRHLGNGYLPAPADEGFDAVSGDGACIIEFKGSLQSSRDLHAAVVRLAVCLARLPNARRAVLVAVLPRMSSVRVEDEWANLAQVLRPKVQVRLALVALAAGRWLAIPRRNQELERIEQAARAVLPRPDDRMPRHRARAGWTPSRQEVWKALLDAWLRCDPPLQMQEIAERAGCSLPTVADTLALLDAISEVMRTKSRAATFAAFPRRSLQEVLTTTRLTRTSSRFVDASGERADPNALLARLERLAPLGVAVGGVVAARAYAPDFDLNGLPRLDVTVLPNDTLAWVRKLDPALKRVDAVGAATAAPVLVVHALARPTLRGTRQPRKAIPLADPAEVLLDLCDLGLNAQADAFVKTMRAKGQPDV